MVILKIHPKGASSAPYVTPAEEAGLKQLSLQEPRRFTPVASRNPVGLSLAFVLKP